MARPFLFSRARQLRKEPTRAEAIVWAALRARRIEGVRFRRQQVIERFIVDFFSPEQRLVIEIDGDVHLSHEQRDAERERTLRLLGLRVLRFTNHDVENHLERVLATIRRALVG